MLKMINRARELIDTFYPGISKPPAIVETLIELMEQEQGKLFKFNVSVNQIEELSKLILIRISDQIIDRTPDKQELLKIMNETITMYIKERLKIYDTD